MDRHCGRVSVLEAPDVGEQLLAFERPARMAASDGREARTLDKSERRSRRGPSHCAPLCRRQLRRLRAPAVRAGSVRAVPRSSATRPSPATSSLGRERLRHVVVRAELEAGDAVALLVARRQHDHRDRRHHPELTADLEAVQGRAASGRARRARADRRVLASDRQPRPMTPPPCTPLFEIPHYHFADGGVVVHDEHFGCSRPHGPNDAPREARMAHRCRSFADRKNQTSVRNRSRVTSGG